MWELLKLGAPRHPKEYSGIIRGIWEVSIEDPLGVVLRTSHFGGGQFCSSSLRYGIMTVARTLWKLLSSPSNV